MKKIEIFLKICKETILRTLYPSVCQICNKRVQNNKDPFCIQCIGRLEITDFHLMDSNVVSNRLLGINNIKFASSMMLVNEGNLASKLLHDLKYNQKPELGEYLGEWYGSLLLNTAFSNSNILIPVPLHPSKKSMRGYNQSEMIAIGLSKSLGIEVKENIVKRKIFTQSQTKLTKTERQKNVDGIFEVALPKTIEGKSVILVDDVLTTGSTIESLAEEVAKCHPKEILVLTLGCALND